MTRLRSRLLVPALAVVTLAVLFPALAKALPHEEAALSVRERNEATLSQFSQLWGLISALWAENGSILDPNGRPTPDTASSGDNGSILDPNG